ncbi:MAG TPA: hypothetical protein VF723_08205 [Pyrinomonadaceae bacterium]|jgi:lycopene cyclase CruA
MGSVLAKPRRPHGAPDLSDFRKRYPLTVASFGALPNREALLDRLWELDRGWEQRLVRGEQAGEAIVWTAPPAGLPVEAEFEVIYAGGVMGLLHGAVMACRYDRRVMVFDAGSIGRTDRDWNISDEELRELAGVELFTRDEIEAAVLNRYRSGFVKFHDAASRVKSPPLWMEGVLDVAIEADRLLALAASKLRARANGSALMEGLRFVRAYVRPERVLVEVEDVRARRRRLFAARLFVDTMGTSSAVARQLDDGRTMTHVWPSVGTVSRGLVRGGEPDQVDFSVGEILVSNEDARDHRQLIWEGLAGSPRRDEYTTSLFFYDAVDSPADKSLLALFEHYFEQLPRYKRAGAQWRVVKPVFGYIPGFAWHGWKGRTRRAADRVLVAGAAGELSSPLTLCSFGVYARNLQRLTHLTELALNADLLDASALSEINAGEPRAAQMSSLAEFLRPTPRSAPSTVNETLNAVMAALHSLDERVRRELFQDRMSFSALKNLLGRTARLYPRIFQRLREHFGARGTFWWLANMAEAAFSERRSRRELPRAEDCDESPAQRFARYAALYKNRQATDGLRETRRSEGS